MKIIFRFERVSEAGDLEGKLRRFLSRMDRKLASFGVDFRQVWVKVKKERGQYEVEGRMNLPGKQVVVKERDSRLLGAMGRLRDGLLKQIERYKRN